MPKSEASLECDPGPGPPALLLTTTSSLNLRTFFGLAVNPSDVRIWIISLTLRRSGAITQWPHVEHHKSLHTERLARIQPP